jgi:hypothetical protein
MLQVQHLTMPRVTDMLSAPPAGSAAWVKKEAFDSQNEEEQDFLRNVATVVRGILDEHGEKNAAEWLLGQRLDCDEQLALWWLLPSHVRSALKRGGF